MPELPHDEEMLDLVDENEKVVGSITHEAAFNQANLRGYYLRAVNVFIINGAGKLWVPRRTHDKKIAPDGLDFSMGEHVQAGEAYEAAAIRGLEEELNIHVSADDLELFCIIKPQPGGPPYINVSYLYHSNIEPPYNPNDFVGAEWLTPEELLRRMRNGEKGKATLIEVTEALLAYQAQHGNDHQRHQQVV